MPTCSTIHDRSDLRGHTYVGRSILLSRKTLYWLPSLIGVVAFVAALTDCRAETTDISFEHDVMAVLSKAGCNAGMCHGNLRGKGGFPLSLRGQDPVFDYDSLFVHGKGRRVNLQQPDQSLILLKPTSQVPHEGGLRLKADSLEYEILRDWISAGARGPDESRARLQKLEVTPMVKTIVAPQESQQLTVTAIFEGGRRRDVTALAVYEPSNLLATVSDQGLVTQPQSGETAVAVRYLDKQLAVRLAFIPSDADFVGNDEPSHNFFDKLVNDRLHELHVNASPLADDATLVRRMYLDVLGVLPTADEATAFVRDERPDKHIRLIDLLLSRPEFADHWALKWSDLLRNEEKVLDPSGVDAFYHWIRDCFAAGRPLDEMVRQLVVGRGSTYKHPAANYYRANRDPLTRAENTAQLFLATRLQCAKCHNHPFDHWTQDDYYAWASIFCGVEYDILENKRRDRLDKNEFNGEQVVYVTSREGITNPSTGEVAAPRFLASRANVDSRFDKLHQLADWLTSADNLQFARAQVNRLVYQLYGVGLVEPIDDFRVTNPASNPDLLAQLAREFVRDGFDVKRMLRLLLTTRAYQRSSIPNSTNSDHDRNFARARIQRLSAEQLLDAQCQVLAIAPQLNGFPEGTRAGQLPGVQRVRHRDKPPGSGDRFLMAFGKPQRLLTCECERSAETTFSQALLLVSGEGINRRLTDPGNRLSSWASLEFESCSLITELYWSALSRAPTEGEASEARKLLNAAGSRRLELLQDIAWAVMNSKEFVYRH